MSESKDGLSRLKVYAFDWYVIIVTIFFPNTSHSSPEAFLRFKHYSHYCLLFVALTYRDDNLVYMPTTMILYRRPQDPSAARPSDLSYGGQYDSVNYDMSGVGDFWEPYQVSTAEFASLRRLPASERTFTYNASSFQYFESPTRFTHDVHTALTSPYIADSNANNASAVTASGDPAPGTSAFAALSVSTAIEVIMRRFPALGPSFPKLCTAVLSAAPLLVITARGQPAARLMQGLCFLLSVTLLTHPVAAAQAAAAAKAAGYGNSNRTHSDTNDDDDDDSDGLTAWLASVATTAPASLAHGHPSTFAAPLPRPVARYLRVQHLFAVSSPEYRAVAGRMEAVAAALGHYLPAHGGGSQHLESQEQSQSRSESQSQSESESLSSLLRQAEGSGMSVTVCADTGTGSCTASNNCTIATSDCELIVKQLSNLKLHFHFEIHTALSNGAATAATGSSAASGGSAVMGAEALDAHYSPEKGKCVAILWFTALFLSRQGIALWTKAATAAVASNNSSSSSKTKTDCEQSESDREQHEGDPLRVLSPTWALAPALLHRLVTTARNNRESNSKSNCSNSMHTSVENVSRESIVSPMTALASALTLNHRFAADAASNTGAVTVSPAVTVTVSTASPLAANVSATTGSHGLQAPSQPHVRSQSQSLQLPISSLSLSISMGFSDDDPKNLTAIESLFARTLAAQSPHVRFVLYNASVKGETPVKVAVKQD